MPCGELISVLRVALSAHVCVYVGAMRVVCWLKVYVVYSHSPSVAELTKLMREVRQAVLLEESKPISDNSTRRGEFQTCSADHAHAPNSDCQQQLSPIQKARAARDDMASKFSPAAVASKIVKRLGSLHSPLD
jgi:hypothetical protein